jgi:hypothetical protein
MSRCGDFDMDSGVAEVGRTHTSVEELDLAALIDSALSDVEQIRRGARNGWVRQQAEECGSKLVHAFIAASRLQKAAPSAP